MTRNEPCPWCGEPSVHYLLHICPGCTCIYRSVSIPGEPQLGSYLEAEPDYECPVHFGKEEPGGHLEDS